MLYEAKMPENSEVVIERIRYYNKTEIIITELVIDFNENIDKIMNLIAKEDSIKERVCEIYFKDMKWKDDQKLLNQLINVIVNRFIYEDSRIIHIYLEELMDIDIAIGNWEREYYKDDMKGKDLDYDSHMELVGKRNFSAKRVSLHLYKYCSFRIDCNYEFLEFVCYDLNCNNKLFYKTNKMKYVCDFVYNKGRFYVCRNGKNVLANYTNTNKMMFIANKYSKNFFDFLLCCARNIENGIGILCFNGSDVFDLAYLCKMKSSENNLGDMSEIIYSCSKALKDFGYLYLRIGYKYGHLYLLFTDLEVLESLVRQLRRMPREIDKYIEENCPNAVNLLKIHKTPKYVQQALLLCYEMSENLILRLSMLNNVESMLVLLNENKRELESWKYRSIYGDSLIYNADFLLKWFNEPTKICSYIEGISNWINSDEKLIKESEMKDLYIEFFKELKIEIGELDEIEINYISEVSDGVCSLLQEINAAKLFVQYFQGIEISENEEYNVELQKPIDNEHRRLVFYPFIKSKFDLSYNFIIQEDDVNDIARMIIESNRNDIGISGKQSLKVLGSLINTLMTSKCSSRRMHLVNVDCDIIELPDFYIVAENSNIILEFEVNIKRVFYVHTKIHCVVNFYQSFDNSRYKCFKFGNSEYIGNLHSTSGFRYAFFHSSKNIWNEMIEYANKYQQNFVHALWVQCAIKSKKVEISFAKSIYGMDIINVSYRMFEVPKNKWSYSTLSKFGYAKMEYKQLEYLCEYGKRDSIMFCFGYAYGHLILKGDPQQLLDLLNSLDKSPREMDQKIEEMFPDVLERVKMHPIPDYVMNCGILELLEIDTKRLELLHNLKCTNQELVNNINEIDGHIKILQDLSAKVSGICVSVNPLPDAKGKILLQEIEAAIPNMIREYKDVFERFKHQQLVNKVSIERIVPPNNLEILMNDIAEANEAYKLCMNECNKLNEEYQKERPSKERDFMQFVEKVPLALRENLELLNLELVNNNNKIDEYVEILKNFSIILSNICVSSNELTNLELKNKMLDKNQESKTKLLNTIQACETLSEQFKGQQLINQKTIEMIVSSNNLEILMSNIEKANESYALCVDESIKLIEGYKSKENELHVRNKSMDLELLEYLQVVNQKLVNEVDEYVKRLEGWNIKVTNICAHVNTLTNLELRNKLLEPMQQIQNVLLTMIEEYKTIYEQFKNSIFINEENIKNIDSKNHFEILIKIIEIYDKITGTYDKLIKEYTLKDTELHNLIQSIDLALLERFKSINQNIVKRHDLIDRNIELLTDCSVKVNGLYACINVLNDVALKDKLLGKAQEILDMILNRIQEAKAISEQLKNSISINEETIKNLAHQDNIEILIKAIEINKIKINESLHFLEENHLKVNEAIALSQLIINTTKESDPRNQIKRFLKWLFVGVFVGIVLLICAYML